MQTIYHHTDTTTPVPGLVYSPKKEAKQFSNITLTSSAKGSIFITDTPRKRPQEKVITLNLSAGKVALFRSPAKITITKKTKTPHSKTKLKPYKKSQKTSEITITPASVEQHKKRQRKCSQGQVMKNTSAEQYALMYGLSGNFQWLHLTAHMFGGPQKQENLICGTRECNIFMLAFEYLIRNLISENKTSEITLAITAKLMPNPNIPNSFTHIATEINYKITADNSNNLELTFYPLLQKKFEKDYKKILKALISEKLFPEETPLSELGALVDQTTEEPKEPIITSNSKPRRSLRLQQKRNTQPWNKPKENKENCPSNTNTNKV